MRASFANKGGFYETFVIAIIYLELNVILMGIDLERRGNCELIA